MFTWQCPVQTDLTIKYASRHGAGLSQCPRQSLYEPLSKASRWRSCDRESNAMWFFCIYLCNKCINSHATSMDTILFLNNQPLNTAICIPKDYTTWILARWEIAPKSGLWINNWISAVYYIFVSSFGWTTIFIADLSSSNREVKLHSFFT